jgi:hypothetical protein
MMREALALFLRKSKVVSRHWISGGQARLCQDTSPGRLRQLVRDKTAKAESGCDGTEPRAAKGAEAHTSADDTTGSEEEPQRRHEDERRRAEQNVYLFFHETLQAKIY